MWWWILDAGVVVAFVVIGRHDHGYSSGMADYVRVATPFLIGLAVSVLALRGWRQLDWRTGLALALGTVLIGVLARRFVWGDGTAWTFVMVTTAFIVAGMIGWRLVAAGLSG
jgi:hypothetical protein